MTQRRSRTTRGIAAVALAAIVLAACAPGATSPSASATASAAPSAAAVKRGGELRFQLIRDSSAGYDPGLATESTVFTIDQQIFDTLYEVQPSGDLKPSLATDYKVSSDGLTYTFTIREGVKFHNGRAMTSDDVKYTVDRLRDPATKSPRRGIYDVVASTEAPNATTFIMKLKSAYAPLIYALSDITAGIVPKEVVQAEGNLENKPVGTGPFKWVQRVRDQSVTVERNADYWRKDAKGQVLPYLDKISFSFNEDPNARSAAVRSANIDFLWNSPPELYQVLKGDASVQIFGGEGTQTFQYMLLNQQRKPFDDVRVRQALYWAIDREKVRAISRPDTTTVLNSGYLPPDHWAGVPKEQWIYKTADVNKAKQLLTDAGYASGFTFSIMTLTGSNFHIRSAQAIQDQLKALNITVNVDVVDTGQLTSRRNKADFDAMVLGFSGTIDPDERFSQTFMTGGGTNYTKFSDAKVDELAAAARKTTDRSERARLYREAQLRLADVGSMLYTYNYHFFDSLQKYVKGYVFNPQLIDYRAVREVWLDK